MLLAGILLFAIGIASAFWGYKLRALFRFIPGLWAGALIGGATGFALTMGPIGAVIGAVLFGIICAVISSASEKTGVFLEFFSYGYAPVLAFVAVSGSIFVAIIPAAIAGAITGMLGRFVSRMWIIVTTSLVGGLMGGVGLGLVTANPMLGFVGGLAMIIGGICVQLNITGVPAKIEAAAQSKGKTATQPSAPPMPELHPEPRPAPTAATPASGPKFCPNCGKPVSADVKFCPECGQSLGRNS